MRIEVTSPCHIRRCHPETCQCDDWCIAIDGRIVLESNDIEWLNQKRDEHLETGWLL